MVDQFRIDRHGLDRTVPVRWHLNPVVSGPLIPPLPLVSYDAHGMSVTQLCDWHHKHKEFSRCSYIGRGPSNPEL